MLEIGDAGRRLNEPFFMKLGAKSFETTDPKYGQVDALTYLMRQPEGSTIVTGFGVLEEGVLYNGFDEPERLKKYQKGLGKAIHRVTPIGGLTFHGLEWDYDLKDAGFVNDPNSPRELNTRTSDRGGLIVLRKQ